MTRSPRSLYSNKQVKNTVISVADSLLEVHKKYIETEWLLICKFPSFQPLNYFRGHSLQVHVPFPALHVGDWNLRICSWLGSNSLSLCKTFCSNTYQRSEALILQNSLGSGSRPGSVGEDFG